MGELVAAVVESRSSPLVAVGGAVIDLVPEPAKEFAIRVFGVYDKLALQVGTLVLLGLFAAAVGMAAVRALWLGFAGVALFAAMGVAAALTRAGASATWALASALAAATAAAVLWLLLRWPAPTGSDRAHEWRRDQEDQKDQTAQQSAQPARRGIPRRQVVAAAWALIGGSAVVGFASRRLGQRRAADAARRAVVLPTPSGSPAVAPPEASVADLSYVTPNESFYRIDTALVVPRIDPSEWRLRIHGRVARPLTLTFDDLLRRPMIERYVTLACVSNEVGGDLIGNARWLGVPVADLLREAGPDPGADQVVSRSVDGFTAGTPTAVLLDGRDAMIAVAMNGEPLPLEHGFPARMVVPGLYGYVSATKWLTELELTTFADFDAYWVRRGWAPQAPIKTQSRIDRPRAGAAIPAGPYLVAGVAWAPHRGVSKVEVQVDQGPWHAATLAAVVSTDTWRLWSWEWDAQPGRHILQVRATDNDGQVQTERRSPPAPDGATGWHMIDVTVA